MTWWIANFKWKRNTAWFKQNPQNIVPWRPKKGISLVNQQLRDMWYEPAKKTDIEETYLQLLQLKEEELKKLFLDPKQPMLVKIIVSNMSDKRKNFDVVEKMLDRSIWKAIQTTANETKITVKWNVSVDELEKMTEKERNELRKAIINCENN